jgi:tRNA dimethylallyltransferase
MDKKKVIIIGGPTGTGKTDVAIRLAKELGGELVNADSTQVYKDMDVGTNKGGFDYSNPEFLGFDNNKSIYNLPIFKIEDVKTHLFSFLPPDRQINVFEWRKMATFCIDHILNKNTIPIVVGGTGLYIDSLLKNYQEVNEKVNIERRNELRQLSLDELTRIVYGINPLWSKDLNESDSRNPQRIIRYIEKHENIEEIDRNQNVTGASSNSFDQLLLYPKFLSETIRTRLQRRVDAMVSESFFNEVSLLAAKFDENSPLYKIIGYKEVKNYLDGKISLEKCKELIFFKHWQYFRRQRTWFEGKGRGYNLVKFADADDATRLSKKFLKA